MENLVITINGLEFVEKGQESEKDSIIKALEQKIVELRDKIEELETNCEILSFENNSLLQGFDKIESILGNIL
jgi:hypothetical protein